MSIPEIPFPEASPARPRTVLYVEDNAANLALVEQIIGRRADLALISAADGTLGLRKARALLPDLVLMDINLPGMSGLEILRQLRADPCTARLPVIALSSDAYSRQIEQGLAAGFAGYLTKPFRIADLLGTIDAVLERAR